MIKEGDTNESNSSNNQNNNSANRILSLNTL